MVIVRELDVRDLDVEIESSNRLMRLWKVEEMSLFGKGGIGFLACTGETRGESMIHSAPGSGWGSIV